MRKSRPEGKTRGKEKGKARISLAQVSKIQPKGKARQARHRNLGTSQDSAGLSSTSQMMRTGGIHGQPIGPPAIVEAAAPMAQVPGIHGTVPDGQEQEAGELSSECYHGIA